MCGIAGIIMLDGSTPDHARLAEMTRAVTHRGPDGEGLEIVDAVGFGHRRLAIIDTSTDGHQPMRSGDGSVRITFNGEIYNYLELRAELTSLGHNFRTKSDTEVLLVAYIQWGQRCVDRLNGMWAFAIHDMRTRTVFCSRDRFGVKPFHYVRIGSMLAFGSEIVQLLPLLPAVRANREVLSDFLFAGIDEPVHHTFFEGVHKLAGGHSLTISLDTGEIVSLREYSIAHRPALEAADLSSAVAAYGEKLEDAVQLRLRADVPVGTCLSGGLDSSTVATLAATPYEQVRGERFRAITAVSEEPGNDETPFARAVVERAGLDWITVRPTYADFAATIDDVVRTQQEPFGGPSICMQWFVMRTARENGIPVMLDGQGGDETLLGYRRYFAAFMLEKWRTDGLLSMLKEIATCRREGAQLGTLGIMISLAIQGIPALGYLKMWIRGRWMRSRQPMPELLRAEAKAMSDVRALQRLDIERTNLPALLRFEDRNSMRFAVETRLPFLDWRSVETALALPSEAKFHRGWTKWLLRARMDNRMPHDVTWRRWKIGFEAPTATWLRMHAAPMREAVLSSKLLAELGHTRKIERSYDRMHAATRWRLFSVAAWERAFQVG
jgi:asparagine synthase (glutamine-hydrolysing)